MANIDHLLGEIRKDRFCKDMRETFCDALKEANSNSERIEETVKTIKEEIETTNATAEVISARGMEKTLGDRLDKTDSQLDENKNLGHKDSTIMTSKQRFEGKEVNVLDFGAKGDALYYDEVTKTFYSNVERTILATDNTVFVQNAINYIIENNGGVLFFPIGRFLISGTVYINPAKSIPITIKGVSDNRAGNDLLYSTTKNIHGTFGTKIVCNNDYVFKVNVDSTDKQVLGLNFAGFEDFIVKDIGFMAIKTGSSTINGDNVNTFKPTTAFKIHGCRFNFNNINLHGMKSLIEQPYTDSIGNVNYSDFVSISHIYCRKTQGTVLKLSKPDVCKINNIYIEQADVNSEKLIHIVSAQQVNISEISASMHNKQLDTFVPKDESGILFIDNCQGVNIRNIYCERQYYYEGMVNLKLCTNVHIDNLGEHIVDISKTAFPLICARRSNIYVHGIHSHTLRKNGYGDIVFKTISGFSNNNSGISLKDIDIRTHDGSTSFYGLSKRMPFLQGVENLERLKYEDMNYIDIKNTSNVYSIIDSLGTTLTSFGIPIWNGNGLELQLNVTVNGYTTQNPLLKCNLMLNRIYMGSDVISYTPCEVIKNLTFLKIGFFDNNTRIQTVDNKCSLRAFM